MSWSILTTPLNHESDLVTVRRRAKRISELLGFDAQDQTRMAAAVSEIARNAITYGSGGRADFLIDGDPADSLVVRIVDRGAGFADLEGVLNGKPASAMNGRGLGIVSARRLVDQFNVRTTAAGTCIKLGKRLPSGSLGTSRPGIAAIADQIASERADTPIDALVEQSQELLRSLNEARERQEQLAHLNRELEDTNRGVVALYAELDERAEQLRRASELKSRFLSNMSHEFRTPLNSIMALSRLLLDECDGPLLPEQERQVGYIRQSAQSLIEMVNDLLDLAKVEAGRIDVKPCLFTAADLFAGLRGALKPLLTNITVELIFEEVTDIPVFWTDQAKVAQILRNFISNALKFTEQGEVRVRVRRDEQPGRVLFAVSDTGIGIDEKDHERVFEEFSQVESRLQGRTKGTGLGLPLSLRLAKLLGGDIRLESAPGEGSTFFLTLPFEFGEEAPADDHTPLARIRTVLIVDDDESFRYVLRQILMSEPKIRIEEAADGEAALKRIARRKPDLIVLDLQMPFLDGFGVINALNRDASTRDIPVIVATSMQVDATLRNRLETAVMIASKDSLTKGTLSVVRKALRARRAP